MTDYEYPQKPLKGDGEVKREICRLLLDDRGKVAAYVKSISDIDGILQRDLYFCHVIHSANSITNDIDHKHVLNELKNKLEEFIEEKSDTIPSAVAS